MKIPSCILVTFILVLFVLLQCYFFILKENSVKNHPECQSQFPKTNRSEYIFKALVTRKARTNMQASKITSTNLHYDIEPIRQSHMIFVGGSARSGTTLMRALLDVHDSIVCGPEVTFKDLLHFKT
jgi:hypothetical protein